jgi:hypothetical protein
MHPRKIRTGAPVLVLVAIAAVPVVACGSDSGGAATEGDDASVGGVASGGGYDFPTGPPVTVPVGYEPPDSYVASTGAYLPVNGKPTLVFVDAIW